MISAHEVINNVHGNFHSLPLELTLIDNVTAPIDYLHAVCTCDFIPTALVIVDGGSAVIIAVVVITVEIVTA